MNFALSGKAGPAVLILFITLMIWIPRQRDIAVARREVAGIKAQVNEIRERSAKAVVDVAAEKQALSDEQASCAAAQAELENELKRLARVDPESRWNIPPESLPDWNPDSPYVWIRKEMAPRFGVPAFNEDGTLRPTVAYVLAIDQETIRSLNPQLKKVLSEYRRIEADQVRRTDEHLPGIASVAGQKFSVTIVPMPERGAALRREFESTLVEKLGEQRADLLSRIGESWLATQFSVSGTEPKTISVVRHADGSFNVSVRSGGNWFSTGGPWEVVERTIPPHVRPMFSELRNPGPAE